MNPRIGAIGLGLLLFITSFYIIPDPNNYKYYPWPHKWVHVYCNHALVWIHLDDAEKRCHPGPEGPQFMREDLQMLAKYPVYGMILYWAPYSFPVIAGVLVWWLVFSYGYGRFKQTIGIGINLKQKKEGDAIYYVYVVALVMIAAVSFILIIVS